MFINYLIYILIFILGLCIGSFLNCIIYRLEKKKKITGRSFCPSCKHTLNWLDLFPVFSFIFLRGKCQYCHKKISIQYPIFELATGVIFVLLTYANSNNILNLIFLFYVSSALIIIFVYDLKHYIIPDKVLFPAIIISVVYNLIPPYDLYKIFYTISAIIIASGLFFIIWFISKGKWMGFGDVKLAILMGLLLGLPNVLIALFLAFFFGAIIGIILMVFGKKGLKSEIPFGPFLITGTFIAILWGNQIMQWYLNIFLI